MIGAIHSFTVYLVDDDKSVLTGMSRLMKASGLKLIVFDTPEKFLSQVRHDWIGCVLLDMDLPQVTGLQVQGRLHAMGIRLPVIAMSGRGDERVCEAARALGARFFLHKPVDDQALLDVISWVSGTTAQASVPQ